MAYRSFHPSCPYPLGMARRADDHDTMDAAPILQALSQLEAQHSRLDGIEVRPGSRGWSDSRKRIGRHVWHMASVKTLSAGDHLRAWRQIVKSREIPIFAQYSLLRTSLETSATVRWLIDPSATQAERIQRGVAAFHDDLNERRKFEEAAARHGKSVVPRAPGEAAVKRIQTLKDEAAAARVKSLEVNIVDCCRDYGSLPGDPKGSGEALYRLFSAIAHGTQWASLPISDRAAVVPTRIGEFSAHLSASSEYTIGATAKIAALFAVAVDELEAYAGGNQDRSDRV